jgi:hypothetical protein
MRATQILMVDHEDVGHRFRRFTQIRMTIIEVIGSDLCLSAKSVALLI